MCDKWDLTQAEYRTSFWHAVSREASDTALHGRAVIPRGYLAEGGFPAGRESDRALSRSCVRSGSEPAAATHVGGGFLDGVCGRDALPQVPDERRGALLGSAGERGAAALQGGESPPETQYTHE